MAKGVYGTLRDQLAANWRLKARPSQLPPPGDWSGWLILAGRGWGKDWACSNCTNELAETGGARRMGLIGPTAGDCRDVMIEGPSGILGTAPNHFRPTYEPSKRKLEWPNGATALVFSAEEPERLRGPNFDFVWGTNLPPGTMRKPCGTWRCFVSDLAAIRAGLFRRRQSLSSF